MVNLILREEKSSNVIKRGNGQDENVLKLNL